MNSITILGFLKEINMEVIVEGGESLSSLDTDRHELMWESREESLVERWKTHCIKKRNEHGVKARVMKKRYTALSIPAIVLPLVLSGFSTVLQTHPLVISGTLMVVAILSGMNGFFNLGRLTQAHYNYEGLYGDLALSIESEMCRPKKARLACDVYLERTRCNISKLDLAAPPV